ncbi:hypothetical protein FHW20_004226 [Ochrobactrum intermedium]|uniref:Succinate-semialdehyde dehydrogenase (NADP(+)) n=2 Tax=Brucella intermedia TaxID=94625 RepID=A0ABR6AUX6_9HYPH|nr:hypothetical protein [Brucella intermedia]MBA8853246.1 hypothetical protein [Brucella intermedia]MDH0125979.1 hypothetical protein [Brucella intermedia GD04153]WLF98474.1 hypothetical protein Q5698_21325 [Brucella intermedia]
MTHDLRSRLTDPSLLAEKAFVAGQWVTADSGGTLAVDNPATGK